MWLVLCQDGDVEALWLAGQLRALTGRRVELVEAGEMVHECRWEHQVAAGATSSRLILAGRTIDSGAVDGVVNRLIWLDACGFEGASAGDREYATGELFALAMSWLESLGPRVLNGPAAFGLSGGWRPTGHWRALARAAGLAVVPYDSDRPEEAGADTDQTVLVVDGQVIGPAGAPAGPLAELARRGGLDLMELRLAGAAVRSVSFLPALSQYGEPCVAAVAAALARRAAPDLAGVR